MRRLAFVTLLLLSPACVPADGSFGLGSVQFTIKGSVRSSAALTDDDVTVAFSRSAGQWRIRFDRIVLGFRTMTIGKVGDDDRCSFRGRGEKSDIVFDPRRTLVQTFNGISPADCEDTGIFLSSPGDTTELGPGVTAADLFDLAQGQPAHALVDATAENSAGRTFLIHLRFDTLRTASRFGGCTGRFETKGVRVRANERTIASATFAPENMFQDSLGFGGTMRLDPFLEADSQGTPDDELTMAEADQLPLLGVRTRFGDGYQLPNGTTAGSFGDFLRALFRFTFFFKEVGTCVGNEPGAEDE